MEQQNETITISRNVYEELLASNENLQSQIDWLTERVRLLTKKQFGTSSEKFIYENFSEQLSIFNEAELTVDTVASLASAGDTAEKTTVKGYTRRKSRSVEDIIPEGAPVEKIEHCLSEKERICEECGTVMDEIDHKIRRTLVIIPATVKVREEGSIPMPAEIAIRKTTTLPGSRQGFPLCSRVHLHHRKRSHIL